MPKNKMKTHKAGAKRFKVTGSGKFMQRKSGRSHLNSKKSSKRKRRLEGDIEVYPGNKPKILIQLPYLQYSR